jgi:hypothetical protein
MSSVKAPTVNKVSKNSSSVNKLRLISFYFTGDISIDSFGFAGDFFILSSFSSSS